MDPECCWTMLRQMARPRPVPPFWRASEGSICWKRSKMLSSLSVGMPRPSSTTFKRMESEVASVWMRTVEATGENLMALERRLVTT